MPLTRRIKYSVSALILQWFLKKTLFFHLVLSDYVYLIRLHLSDIWINAYVILMACSTLRLLKRDAYNLLQSVHVARAVSNDHLDFGHVQLHVREVWNLVRVHISLIQAVQMY